MMYGVNMEDNGFGGICGGAHLEIRIDLFARKGYANTRNGHSKGD